MKKSRIHVSGIIWFLYAIFAIIWISLGAKTVFNGSSEGYLATVAKTLLLQFDLGPNQQIPLVLQMAHSPVTREFLKDPDNDSIKDIAMEQMKAFQDSFLGKNSFWTSILI